MKKYLDEQLAFDALKQAVESAVQRELTEIELRYIKWLTTMDYETIGVFVKLFTDASHGASFDFLEKF